MKEINGRIKFRRYKHIVEQTTNFINNGIDIVNLSIKFLQSLHLLLKDLEFIFYCFIFFQLIIFNFKNILIFFNINIIIY